MFLRSTLYLFIVLQATLLASPPDWFVLSNLTVKENEIIGYGAGSTRNAARKIAIAEIASAISSTVSSNTHYSLSYVRKDDDEQFDKLMDQNILIESDVKLDQLTTVKAETRDGIFYIALRYIDLPYAQKIRNSFDSVQGLSVEKNTYLLQTPFFADLKQAFGFYPNVNFVEERITVGNKVFHLNFSYVKQLFANVKDERLKLYMPSRIKSKAFYFIDIESTMPGYLTLFYTEEDGATSLLFENRYTNKNDRLSYPDKNQYAGLQTFLRNGVHASKDLVLAVLCYERRNFGMFDPMGSQFDKFPKLFTTVLDRIEGCVVSSNTLYVER